MKWEYMAVFGEARGKTITSRSGKPKNEPTLDVVRDLGADGWELVSVTINPHSEENGFYFKRPLKE